MSTPDKKVRKPWWDPSTGWGENGDQPNPIVKLGKQIATDAVETVSDLKNEPEEVPYRIRERARSYFPAWHSYLKQRKEQN